jgi:Holliday junction DNA helicase RuvA
MMTMIRRITGYLSDISPGSAIIDVHGIGYLVAVPTQPEYLTLSGEVTFDTYLAVRETALDLYGFLSSTEHLCFIQLLNIPKIGPKSALAILSQARPEMIAHAVANNDSEALHKLSGIGKKTCESIVHYFRSKEIILVSDYESALSSTQTDAIEALVTLGYDRGAAREIIKEQPSGNTLNELITTGIKNL